MPICLFHNQVKHRYLKIQSEIHRNKKGSTLGGVEILSHMHIEKNKQKKPHCSPFKKQSVLGSGHPRRLPRLWWGQEKHQTRNVTLIVATGGESALLMCPPPPVRGPASSPRSGSESRRAAPAWAAPHLHRCALVHFLLCPLLPCVTLAGSLHLLDTTCTLQIVTLTCKNPRGSGGGAFHIQKDHTVSNKWSKETTGTWTSFY